MIDKTIIPKNIFDMKSAKDKITELKRRHDEIVTAAENCIDEYNQYCETQKELLRSKLPELVFGNCKHTNVKWDKNRYEGGSTGFWICADCNEIVGKNYWIKKGGGWTTKADDKIIDEIVDAFLQEYPDISTDICFDDELFIEYKFNGIELIGWQEFVNEWKLKIITDEITKRCTAYNDDYTICMTGDSVFYLIDEIKKEEPSAERPEIDEPADNISLIMSDKIGTRVMLSFLNDFINLIHDVESVDFDVHENQIKNIIHPNWILDRMMI